MLQPLVLPARRATLITIATLFALLSVVPAILPVLVSAAPAVTERELQSTSAVASDATTLTWVFGTPAAGSNLERIEIEFCDSPLTDCNTASGIDGSSNAGTDNIPVLPGSPTAVLAGPGSWAAAANSATRSNGDATGTNNQINIDVTTSFNAASTEEASISIAGLTNDEAENASYYTRLRFYSTDTPTVTADLLWEGVFAQSTSQTLTVNARVQERLDFCVGSTTVNDATTAVGDCSTITASGGTVDIGNIENGAVNVSPVDTDNGGSETNGVAFIRTNAVNGASIAYRALDDNSSGTLKVASATCDDSNSGTAAPDFLSVLTTDQCFNTSTTQGVFASGTERFGMVVAGVNCSNTNAYTCDFSGDNYNMRIDGSYDPTDANTFVPEGNGTDLGRVTGTTAAGFAWDANPATTTTLASSAGTLPPTGFRVVDSEALILKFAATAGVTTPTGAYSVQTDFIATTTF